MLQTFLRSKIHAAYVTGADLNYMGSITLGGKLLRGSGMMIHEKVDIYNVTNGERFSTYIIAGEEEGSEIILNGAAAHLVKRGDKVIIAAYCQVDIKKDEPPEPKIIIIRDKDNSF